MTTKPAISISRARALGLSLAPLAFGLPATVRAQAQANLKIRIAEFSNDTYGEALYAEDAGFFAKAGLATDHQIFSNGSQIATAVIAGAADVGVASPVALAIAATHGVVVRLIAGGAVYSASAPTTGLVVAKDSPLREARDLEGKIIGTVTIVDSSTVGITNWLVQNGADVSKVRFIEMPFAEMVPAIQRGTIAACSLSEPFLTALRTDIRVLGHYYDSIAKRFMQSVWFSTPAVVEKSPEVIQRFRDAIYAAGKWANANHSKTEPILAKYAKMDATLIASMTRTTFSDSLDVQLIQPSLDVAVKYKLLSRPVATAEMLGRAGIAS